MALVMQMLIICLMATIIWAEETVNVMVDRHRVNEGDSITLTVTAKNVQNEPDVSLPKMQDFKIVSGPNQSSSTNVQFINGKMTKSSTVTLMWTLIPIRTGQITIPEINITYSSLLMPLLAGSFLWQFALLCHKALEMDQRTILMVVLMFIAVCVNLIGNTIFLPHYGVIATAYTYMASAGIYIMTVIYFSRHKFILAFSNQ